MYPLFQCQAPVRQFDIVWEDREANYAKLRSMLQSTAPQRGSLIVLPEMFATGFSMNCLTVLEDEDGPTIHFLTRIAKEFSATVLGGVALRRPDGIGQNGAIAVNQTGEILGRYFKIHPYSHGHEDKALLAGDRVITFKWNEAIVAPSICYDVRFPEIYRLAAKRGAQLMALISNFGDERIIHWPTLIKARAIENQAYFIACNRIGNDPGVSYSMAEHDRRSAGAQRDAEGAAANVSSPPRSICPTCSPIAADFPALRDMRDTYENC